MNDPLLLQLLTGITIGLGAGYLGAFMVLKRMSLVGDALSHVALPGIALALLLHINPFIGAFAALTIAVIGIWTLEQRTNLPSETLVGIFFTISLALGLLLTPEPELLEALFGDIAKIGPADLFIAILAVGITFGVMSYARKGFILSIISSDLAKASGIAVRHIHFLFLMLVALIVALGLNVAGTLLMGSLVIIPAAAAKNLASNMFSYTWMASILGGVAAGAGILLAYFYNFSPGPMVVLAGGVIFLLTLFSQNTRL